MGVVVSERCQSPSCGGVGVVVVVVVLVVVASERCCWSGTSSVVLTPHEDPSEERIPLDGSAMLLERNENDAPSLDSWRFRPGEGKDRIPLH